MHLLSGSNHIRVLVADDTRVHTELLADVLRRDGGLEVTTSPSSSENLITHLNQGGIDVLLIGSNLDGQPGRGFEVLRDLQSSRSFPASIMLINSSEREIVLEAFRVGARGVFSKDESVSTLNKCVRRVHEGQIWAKSEQVSALVEAWSSCQSVRAVDARGMNLLSKREFEIVTRVAQGLTNREIAEQLRLSHHTVKNCLFRIFDKLGVSNRVELLVMTIDRNRDGRSGYQCILENNGDLSLHDEATLIECQRAAEHGVLMAQLALAQHYAMNGQTPDDRCNSYVWYSIAVQQLSQACTGIAQEMTVVQVLEAEQKATRWLEFNGKKPVLRQKFVGRCA
jgi:DNA-binding NarL/FixJ family response regulator